jgi:hypothetical protein
MPAPRFKTCRQISENVPFVRLATFAGFFSLQTKKAQCKKAPIKISAITKIFSKGINKFGRCDA